MTSGRHEDYNPREDEESTQSRVLFAANVEMRTDVCPAAKEKRDLG
ncbi:MAG TPA: hypothetical protein VFJ58_22805 [Armatimonadota bacterium]|nr:hypothetical protein [Armatimonadota bacterium]